jgi:hypothetical protein
MGDPILSFSFACSLLYSVQALKCNTNTCPTGITTQNPDLIWGLDPASKQVRVANFHRETVKSCIEIMEASGINSWAEIRPHHVGIRVALGQVKTYDEVFEHMKVSKGELLEGKGPQILLDLYNNKNGHTRQPAS